MTLGTQRSDTELASGTLLLRGQYEVDRPLSQGGFGITYLARDSLNRQVVIKECFPQDFCARSGVHVIAQHEECEPEFARILKQFKREAYRLAALDHPGIVRVHQVFEENGTAFMAMDFVDGVDLITVAEEEPERLDAQSMRAVLVEALEAVRYTHEQGILHRDLAPDNFILDADNHVTLIDFGSAYEHGNVPGAKHTKLLAVKDGYSPYEFYVSGDLQDESSDLYSLGATFHYLITGYAPPNSQARLAAISAGNPDPFLPLVAEHWDLDAAFLAPINHALEVHQKDRLRSAAEWLARLSDAPLAHFAAPKAAPQANIAVAISQLVSDTNSALTPGLPHNLKSGEPDKEAVAVQQNHEQRQPVDIFGNPIEDVAAFLREQDKMSKRGKLRSSTAGAGDDEAGGNGRAAGRSAIGRMLSRLRPGKRDSSSAVLQN